MTVQPLQARARQLDAERHRQSLTEALRDPPQVLATDGDCSRHHGVDDEDERTADDPSANDPYSAGRRSWGGRLDSDPCVPMPRLSVPLCPAPTAVRESATDRDSSVVRLSAQLPAGRLRDGCGNRNDCAYQ